MDFKEELEIFVTALKAEGMCLRTINDYYKHMEWFTRFLTEHPPDVTTIQDLTSAVIRGYINYIQSECNQYQSVENREKKAKGLCVLREQFDT